MQVHAILREKGSDIHTIGPGATVAEAAGRLRELGIGALIVSEDGAAITGIISERDIVYGLAETGAGFLDVAVRDAMTADVVTCSPEDTGRGVLSRMTEHRMRHVPVVDGGKLVGLVSIGDVVKSRLQEIMSEADALRDYIASA